MTYEQWSDLQWDNEALYSALYEKCYPSEENDVIGSSLWVYELLEDPSVMGVAITGAKGCGKHTAASFLIKDFVRQHENKGSAYVTLHFDGFDADGNKDFVSHLRQFLAECRDGFGNLEQPYNVLIVLDEPAQSPDWAHIRSYINHVMLEYFSADSYPQLFFVIISEQDPMLPSASRALLRRIRFDLPNTDLRRAVCKAWMHEQLQRVIPVEDVVSLCEGLTLSDLKEVISCIGKQASMGQGQEYLMNYIRMQITPVSLPEKQGAFYEGFLHLFEEYVDKASHIPVGVSEYRTIPTANPSAAEQHLEHSDEAKREQQLRSLTAGAMMVEVFGQDRLDKVVSSIS